jgi:hypothetical protein
MVCSRRTRDSALVGVIEGALDQLLNVGVVEAVVHDSAFLAVRDQAGFAQASQLVADGGFGQVEAGGDVADAQFDAAKGAQDAQPRRVGHGFQQRAGGFNQGRCGDGSPRLRDGFRVYVAHLAQGIVGQGVVHVDILRGALTREYRVLPREHRSERIV